jgi:eukaryotic-like serine/threonine-protein kinase
MSSCPSCGQEFAGGERFCPSDGAKLPTPDETPTARETDPLIGKVVDGRYRVQSKIGEGGMGAVYRAVHVHMDKSFALKILRPHMSADAVAVKRFQREARSASLLDHEHCIRVTDFGYSADGLLFLAMEHLEGRTLATELHDVGALPARRVVAIGTQIAQALAHAHDQGLIHRDLKPDNVFLLHRPGGSDFVKVLDFGLAKLLEKEMPEHGLHRTSLTEHGIVFGTPEFMSPEQAEGRPLDAQTDIYSLGICLYHMLTGQLPFQAPTYMSILTKHILEAPVSPTERRPDLGLPPSLVAIVMQCLEKAPTDRPPGARAVADLLARCDATPSPAGARVPASVASHPTVDVSLPSGGIPLVPLADELEPLPPRRGALWIVAPILIVALIAAAGVLAFSRKEPAPEGSAGSAEMAATPAEVPTPDAPAPPDASVLAAVPFDAAPRVAAQRPSQSAADHLAKAAAFRKKGDKIQERVHLQEALALDPDNAQANLLLGEAALADGNKELGCKHLKRAVRQGAGRGHARSGNAAKALYEKAECDLVGP